MAAGNEKLAATLPCVYKPLPLPKDLILQKLREEARGHFLHRQAKETLTEEELRNLWFILEEFSSTSTSNGEQMIDYKTFSEIQSRLSDKFRSYTSPLVFLKVIHKRDSLGRVCITDYFNYVMRKNWVIQTRMGLSLYDLNGQGFLREPEMQSYIIDLIPTIPQLSQMDAEFESSYVCIAVRKFFFFLDTKRTKKIRIIDIIGSGFLDDLLELRSDDLIPEQIENNWFSLESAIQVYDSFVKLDLDNNGMLSKNELALYNGGTLTPTFINRIFEECKTYNGEMDFKAFVDFVLALDNRKEHQSLTFLFRMMDIDHVGYLTKFTLWYFFKDIQEKLGRNSDLSVSFEDVAHEIFDIVRPSDPERITLKDVIKCGQGDVVLSIVIDLEGFWRYENRELMLAQAVEAAAAAAALQKNSQSSSRF